MKVAFVTGGATGIGRATVDKFLQQGMKVGVLDINREAIDELSQHYPPEAAVFTPGDVRRSDSIKHPVSHTVAKFGPLDVVFANAGSYRSNTIFNVTYEELDLNLRHQSKGRYLHDPRNCAIPHDSWRRCHRADGVRPSARRKKNSMAYGASKGAVVK